MSRVLALFVGVAVSIAMSSIADADDAGVGEADAAPIDAAPADAAPAESTPTEALPVPIQTTVPAPAPSAVEPTQEKKAQKAKKAKKAKKPRGTLAVGGRVIVRGAVTKVGGGSVSGAASNAVGDSEATGEATMQSARARADYRWKALRAVLQVELAGKARLKTTYVQLRVYDEATRVSIRAGHFKMPFSAIQLDSFWNLPTADRGLLHEVLVKRLQLAGRAIGTTINVELPGAWKPALTAGAFQGSDDAGDPLVVSADDRFGQDGVVRITAQPVKGLELGAAGALRVGKLLVLPAVVRRAWATELDATLELPVGPGRVRAWVEGMVGTSWLVADPNKVKATFVAGRGILGYRIGDTKFGRRYLEPYALIGALDPDSDIRNDVVLEMTGGLTYGASDAWRIQLEIERWTVGSNAPIGIVELGVAPATTTTVMLQLGAQL